MISVKRYIPTDALTNEDEVKFKVKFNTVTYGVDANDFVVTGSGNSEATISKVEYIGSNEYMISVSGITSNNGTLGLELATNTTIITNGGSAIDKTFVTPINETFTLDNTAPTVTITPDRAIYAGTTAFKANIVFFEKVTNLTLADISSTNATISNLVQIDDFTYQVVVTPTNGTGNITLDFAKDKVNDIAGNLNTAASQVTIYANKAPSLTTDKTDAEVNNLNEAITGTLGSTDENSEAGEKLLYSITGQIADKTQDGFTHSKKGVYGTLYINETTGDYKFVPNSDAIAEADKTETEKFQFNVTDSLGAKNSKDFTITVNGVNDAPVISVETGNSASADLTETDTTLSAKGSLTLKNLDKGQTLSVSKFALVITDKTGSYSGTSNTNLFNMLTLSNDSNSINWEFSSKTEAFDYLAKDETLILKYTIKATDSKETDSNNQEIIIKITGTNDAPKITASTVTALDNTNSTAVTASGILSFSDIDTTDTPTASFIKEKDVSYVVTRGEESLTLDTDTITNLQNALTLKSDGTWSYTLDTTQLKDNTLAKILSGDKIVVTYKLTVSDAKGGIVTKDLKFILIGDGTGAKLSFNDDAGSIIEGLKLTDSGTLNFNGTPIKRDVSINDSSSLTSAQIDIIKSGLKITPTADGSATNWEYSIAEDKIDFLAEGQTVTAKFDLGDSALVFSGDDSASIPSPTLESSFTVELWIKLDAPTSNWQAVLDKGRYTTLNDWYIITNNANNQLIMGYDYFTNANNEQEQNQIFLDVTDLNWHHVAFSYDKTNTTWTAYLDGISKGTFTKEYTPTANSILLGNNGYNGGSQVELNELRIWNDVRTQDEIKANMNSVISNPNGDATLLSYYKFDETSGTVIVDSEGDNNGTISEISTPTWIGSSSSLTVTITGTNDAPVITSSISDAKGSVTEAGYSASGTPSANGTLNSTDVDSKATASWSLDKTTGTYGNISIDSTGKWTYTLDESKVSILEIGDKKTEIFTATITDDKGATAQQTIIIEVNGTNDAPVITTPTPISYKENSVDPQTGKLTVVDDGNDTKKYSIDGQNIDTTQDGFTHSKKGVYGTLYINEITGDYKFVPNESAIKALTDDGSEISKFTVTDSLGATSTQDLTISFKGLNDAPTITVGTNDIDSKEIYETNTTLISSGTLTVTDIDIAQLVSSAVVQSMTIDGVTSTDATALGWLTLNTTEILNNTETTDTLTWTFNSGSEYFNSLSQGETKTLVYTIRVSDGTLFADKTVSITIKGTNDAPKITVETGDSTSATLEELNETLSVNDTLTVNEIEPNDKITATVESVSVNLNSTVSSLALPSNAILKAMLSLDKSSLLANTTDIKETLTWTFNSGENEYFDKIASGETLILDYVVRVIDSANPSKIDTKTVTITINGSNDAPVIDTYASNDVNINGVINSGKPLELADKGTIAFNDVDFSNRPTATEITKSITAYKRDKTTLFALTPTQINNITDGFKISSGENNTNNGVVNWEYAISQANIDFLGSAEQVVAIFTISVDDGKGGKASQDITIKITGENKTPILSEAIKNINEANNAITDTISMTASDANLTDILTVSVESGTYQLNGQAPRAMSDAEKSWLSLKSSTVSNGTPFDWNFNTDSTTFNELNTGETVKLVYTVKVIDDAPAEVRAFSTKTVTVTITGTNDAPVAVVDVSETTENSAITIDVLANDTDLDSADNSSNFSLTNVSITTNNHSDGYNASNVTNVATVSIVDNKLVFNPNDEFDYLAVGETASVVVTYTMSDNEGLTSTSTATITIKGSNDAPIITVKESDKTNEDFVESINSVITSGTLSLNDKDTSNIVTASVDSVTISGTAQVGTKTTDYFKSMLTLSSETILNNTQNDGTITWNFDSGSDIFNYVAKDEVLILTYKIKATDSSQVSATQDVVIKITGTNDAPVLNEVSEITFTDTASNDTFSSYTGSLVSSDVDLTDGKTYSIASQIPDTAEIGFTHSKLRAYGTLYLNEISGAYKYIPNDVKIEELITDEVDEFTFNIMDDSQEINNIDSKIFRVNLLGVNDTPVISVEFLNSANKTINETNSKLSTNGTLSVVDLDTTQTVSVSKVDVVVSGVTTGLLLDNETIFDMLSIDSENVIDNLSRTGTINWTFNSNGETFDYLASGETLTLTYTIKASDDDSSKASDTQTVTITIVGTNDTPKVLSDNIDTKTPFGKEFVQETAYLFSDIDTTDNFTFTTSKLPQGLSIDKNTGIISGRAVEPGNFTITITAFDSGNPTLSISRTFNLLVIAPPQNSATDSVTPKNTNDFAQQIVKEITVDRINDTITAFSSTSNMSDVTGNKNQVEQLLNPTNGALGGKNGATGTNLDITRTELASLGQTTSNNPNDKIITANANLNLDPTGKVNINDKANQAFQTLGLTIEKISLVQDQIEVKILDTRVGQKYSVSLSDGNPLPEGLSFDPNTGKILGVLPEGVTELNISIKALSNDGTTRVLNLKIDLKDLKNKQRAFNTLSEQVEKQSFKMSDYGSFINSLVSKAV